MKHEIYLINQNLASNGVYIDKHLKDLQENLNKVQRTYKEKIKC